MLFSCMMTCHGALGGYVCLLVVQRLIYSLFQQINQAFPMFYYLDILRQAMIPFCKHDWSESMIFLEFGLKLCVEVYMNIVCVRNWKNAIGNCVHSFFLNISSLFGSYLSGIFNRLVMLVCLDCNFIYVQKNIGVYDNYSHIDKARYISIYCL